MEIFGSITYKFYHGFTCKTGNVCNSTYFYHEGQWSLALWNFHPVGVVEVIGVWAELNCHCSFHLQVVQTGGTMIFRPHYRHPEQ